MSSAEQEIIEKFQQLAPVARQRLLKELEQTVFDEAMNADATDFDYHAWMQEIERLRRQISTRHEMGLSSLDTIGILRGIRDGDDE